MSRSVGSQSLLTASSSQWPPNSLLRPATTEPLCGDPEGWGPMSDLRWDLTPCFLDIWIVGVALWGIVFGAGALWYLLNRRVAQEVPKNWHFYAKL